jgi:hypothetical protein
MGEFLLEELGFDLFVISTFRLWIFCVEASWLGRGLGWRDECKGLYKWYVDPEGSMLGGGACVEWAITPLGDVKSYGGVNSVNWSSGLASIAGCCGFPVSVF